MQKTIFKNIKSTATFSPNRIYRYDLIRQWDKQKGTCLFICLNPSTADETTNDPTVRRCINYARDWGYGRFIMCNLFAYRATEPKEMLNTPYPVSNPRNQDRNDETIIKWAAESDKVICAWGNHGTHMNRSGKVLDIISEKCHPGCLKTNQSGQPVHPLYQPKDIEPKSFSL